MNKILFAPALVAAISLGGCGTLSQLPAEITTVQSQTIAIAEALCSFEPTASTIVGVVASLFPGGGPISVVATGAAKAICQAVTAVPPASARLAGAHYAPMVNGVLVEGQFVSAATSKAAKKSLKLNGVTIEGRFIK
jgi:hypothetical protein